MLAFAVLFGAEFMPLFGGPGYEIAARGPGVAQPGRDRQRSRRHSKTRRALRRLFGGVASGTLLSLVGFATTIIHGIRVGFCDAPGGIALFALGPLVGWIMGGAWGALVGELLFFVSRPILRKVLAFVLGPLLPLLGILLSVWRFYSTPTIFASIPSSASSRERSTTRSSRPRFLFSPIGWDPC